MFSIGQARCNFPTARQPPGSDQVLSFLTNVPRRHFTRASFTSGLKWTDFHANCAFTVILHWFWRIFRKLPKITEKEMRCGTLYPPPIDVLARLPVGFSQHIDSFRHDFLSNILSETARACHRRVILAAKNSKWADLHWIAPLRWFCIDFDVFFGNFQKLQKRRCVVARFIPRQSTYWRDYR